MSNRSLSVAVLVALAAPCLAEDVPAFKKGDKVVFLGDSITQGGNGPKGYVGLIRAAFAEKHKDLGVEVVNAGVSGNKVPDLTRRLQRDVLDKKLALVVIYIGINDVWHGEKNPANGTSKADFEAGLRAIVEKITAAGGKVVICTPTVIGEKSENTHDAKLDEYSDVSRKIAADLKLPLVDLRKAFADHLKANNKENKDKGVLTGDRVHLNEAGNKLVADSILKTILK